MVFVRAKTIKGKRYAYLVQSVWKKGKVRQVSKKYLGKIVQLPTTETPITADETLSKKEFIIDLLTNYFLLLGFQKHPRKQALVRDEVCIHFPSKKITQNEKAVVLQANDRFIYGPQLARLLDFYEPEGDEERPGTRLAQACSDIGLSIHPSSFVSLYKKIYT